MGRRSHSAICLDNKLLIFGGFNGSEHVHMNDLWQYDPILNMWKQLHPRGEPPVKRRRHCMCQVGDKIFIFGGTSPYDGPPLYFTPEQLELIPEVDPTPTDGPAITLIDHNDLHVLDTDALRWHKPTTTGTPPLPRANHSSSVVEREYGGGGSLTHLPP